MTKRCPKCGSELTYFNRGGELVFDCHYDKKDCRIAALEKGLEEAKANALVEEEQLLAVLPEDFGAVEYIKYLEGEQLRIPDLVHENETLKSERNAALAQVVGLEFKVRSLHIGLRLLCPLTHPESEARKWADHNLTSPLPEATSATAQRVRTEIECEVLDKAWERVQTHERFSTGMGDKDLRAAILGEKDGKS